MTGVARWPMYGAKPTGPVAGSRLTVIEAGEATMQRYDWYGGDGFAGNTDQDAEVLRAKTFAGLSMGCAVLAAVIVALVVSAVVLFGVPLMELFFRA
ncbi:hypothetical protein [Streptomyces rubiginosohelvolus]|uniref:hypothetical protein n=1 Tax=Streptomyces rubiginosohelvolus TaxID=67362 RepID=UPI0037F5F8F8